MIEGGFWDRLIHDLANPAQISSVMESNPSLLYTHCSKSSHLGPVPNSDHIRMSAAQLLPFPTQRVPGVRAHEQASAAPPRTLPIDIINGSWIRFLATEGKQDSRELARFFSGARRLMSLNVSLWFYYPFYRGNLLSDSRPWVTTMCILLWK